MDSLRNPRLCRAIDRTRAVLDLVTDKWVISVIYSLSEGTKRFGRLEREVCGVSQKMLTQTLRGLERDGLIARKVYPVVPPRVEYSLTPLGKTLVEPLTALRDWAVAHGDDVEAARHRPEEETASLTARRVRQPV
jgi:DNA-binding HxlR family transcriptional regulator